MFYSFAHLVFKRCQSGCVENKTWHLSVYVDFCWKCLGDGVVRNTAASGVAGSGRRVSRFNVQLLYQDGVSTFDAFDASGGFHLHKPFAWPGFWFFLHKLSAVVWFCVVSILRDSVMRCSILKIEFGLIVLIVFLKRYQENEWARSYRKLRFWGT